MRCIQTFLFLVQQTAIVKSRTSQNYIELYKHIIQNLEWFNHAKEEIEAILEKEQVTPEDKFTPITL